MPCVNSLRFGALKISKIYLSFIFKVSITIMFSQTNLLSILYSFLIFIDFISLSGIGDLHNT